MREAKAPYIPQISSEVSNENFDQFEEEDPFHRVAENKRKGGNRKVDMNFVGYTYKADVESEKAMLVNVLKGLDIANEGQYETPEFNQKENYVEDRAHMGQQYLSENSDSGIQQSQGRITTN